MSERSSTTWIQTYTGRRFWPLAARPHEVSIHDIAHALSNLCRFTGHTEAFYSVAQHSVLVSQVVPPADALWGLLHDAAEAYINDLNRPVKHSAGLGTYRVIEQSLSRVIAQRFGLSPEIPGSVREADDRMLWTERRDLLKPREFEDWCSRGVYEPYPFRITPLGPVEAKQAFIRRYLELRGVIPGTVSEEGSRE